MGCARPQLSPGILAGIVTRVRHLPAFAARCRRIGEPGSVYSWTAYERRPLSAASSGATVKNDG